MHKWISLNSCAVALWCFTVLQVGAAPCAKEIWIMFKNRVYIVQGYRKVWKCGGTSCNMESKIGRCKAWGKAPPLPCLPVSDIPAYCNRSISHAPNSASIQFLKILNANFPRTVLRWVICLVISSVPPVLFGASLFSKFVRQTVVPLSWILFKNKLYM